MAPTGCRLVPRAAATLLALAAIPAFSADAEFVGVMQSPQGSLIALKAAPESPPTWRRVGDRFGDYVVARYDSQAEAVTLTKEGEQVRLSLRAPRVRETGEAESTWSSPAVKRNLRRLIVAAYQHLWDTGTLQAVVPEFVGENRALLRVEAEAGEDYAMLRFRLQADGGMQIVDANGIAVTGFAGEPASIAVAVGTPLAEVSRRLGRMEARLAELNPEFGREPAPGATRAVRIW